MFRTNKVKILREEEKENIEPKPKRCKVSDENSASITYQSSALELEATSQRTVLGEINQNVPIEDKKKEKKKEKQKENEVEKEKAEQTLVPLQENFLVEEQKGEWFFIPEETIPEINIEQNELEDGSEVSIGESQDEATQNTAPETFIDGGDDENSIPPGVRNIDEDASDPQLCSEYAQDIMRTLFEGEVDPNYMNAQPNINWGMRKTLVSWMVGVHWKLKLLPETLFLSVNILDRYLSLEIIESPLILQLIGTSCLLSATKFEENYIDPGDLLYFYPTTNYQETLERLKLFEIMILTRIRFQLNCPSPFAFLRRNSMAENYDTHSRTVAKYLIEITILDETFLQYYISMIAAASTWLARKMLKRENWDATLTYYSGYTEEQLQPCVNQLTHLLQTITPECHIYQKYSSTHFLRASVFVARTIEEWNTPSEEQSE